MVRFKLKRLKRSYEKKILKENKGLYSQLVEENYAQSKPETNRRVWIPVLSSVVAFALVFTVGITSLLGGLLKKGGNAPSLEAGENSISDSQSPNASSDLEQILTTATFGDVEDALQSSKIIEGLKFKNITSASTGGAQDYFRMEVDSMYTLDILVKINPEYAVSESYLPGGEVLSTVNAYEFRVDYSFTKRKIEDYYSFSSKAVVQTGDETYYIKYNYSSASPDCELLALIETCITPN